MAPRAAVARTLRAQLDALVRREARIPPGESEAIVRCKVDGFFWPMYQWIDEVVTRSKSAYSSESDPSRSCVCVGLSCVQGGGKTTTTRILREMLQQTGRRCAVLSLDDVYLTRQQQIAVAEANPTNPLLQHRGNPGTQDLSLLMRLVEQSNRQGEIAIPRYDKSLHDGRGDRVPEAEWERMDGPLDVLIVEGWCLGFRAQHPTNEMDSNLLPVNQALVEYEQLYKALDALVVIKVETLQWVYGWREQQESHLRAAGKPALSPDEVRDFVDRFMPAYNAYLPSLYRGPQTAGQSSSHLDTIPQLHLEIDVTRTPSSTSPPVEYNIHSQALALSS